MRVSETTIDDLMTIHGHIAYAFNLPMSEEEQCDEMSDLMIEDKAVLLGWWYKNILEKGKGSTNFTWVAAVFLIVACVNWTGFEAKLTSFMDRMILQNPKDSSWCHLYTLGLGGVILSPVCIILFYIRK